MKSCFSKPIVQLSRGFAIIILLLLSSGTAMAKPIAERITPANAQQYLVDCPDRVGGIGDWYIANDVIWAIIDDVANVNLISSSGGTIVDLGLVGRKGEQFVQFTPILNMTRDLIVPFDSVRVEQGDMWVSIVVSTTHGLRPERPGFGVLSEEAAEKVNVETEYRLVEGENYIRLKTTISNSGNKKANIFSVADILWWGDDALKPFGGSQKKLGRSRGTPRGFQHPVMDPESVRSIVKSIGGFTYAAGGGVNGLSPVSYGLCSPTEFNNGRLLWGVNDRMVSALGPFTGKFRRPFDMWKMILSKFFFGISPGKPFVYERLLVVGGRNDVASVTDTIFPLLGMANGSAGVVGKVEPADADASVLIFSEDDGIPITQARPIREGDRAGQFRAVLPPGKYTAEVRSVERDPDLSTPEIEPITKQFRVEEDDFTDIGVVALPPLSALLLEVFEGDKRLPARVIIHGADGTPDPEMGNDLLGFTLSGAPTAMPYSANWVSLDGNETGPVRVDLRPGKYTLYATHGFEYSVETAEINVTRPGSKSFARIFLEKVIDTRGMMSGDFHVHSAPSADSAMMEESRVAAFVAEDVDLLVATDHDILTDFAPVIERMNLSHRLSTIVGVEATSTQRLRTTPFTIGHYNSWPLRYEPFSPRRGMVVDDGIRPRDLFDRLRSIADGESIIQVNHGREGELGGEASYFNALGLEFDKPYAYDPSLPMTDNPNSLLLKANSSGTRDIDFDAMELLNGPDYEQYILLRKDWFSLLNQGYIKTAMANSDTHVKASIVGYPRTYILLKDPAAGRAEEEELVQQIRGQKAFGTTGPIIKLNVNGEGSLGDIVKTKDGGVSLNIKILAPDWVPLDEVHVYANGEMIKSLEMDSQSEIVRFDRDLQFSFEKDTWLMVETTLSSPPKSDSSETEPHVSEFPAPPGGLYNIVAPDFVPLAFTNPVFVDADGNGRFDPPGISRPTAVSSPAEQE